MAVEVHLVTPERELWSGEADMVIARGVEGEVGILAGHAPMLIRLAIAPLRIRVNERDVVAVADGGFLHVTTDEGTTRVDVLATGAELATEIDPASAESRLEEAQRRLAERDDEEGRAELARALVRVHVAA
ncbi:MAG TPA: ATP synthase F1 subunit epsilon [Actinomycetota bacterium]|nr:ATP synthase F1 subunit epsilon [Actinomycetota bacterium]